MYHICFCTSYRRLQPGCPLSPTVGAPTSLRAAAPSRPRCRAAPRCLGPARHGTSSDVWHEHMFGPGNGKEHPNNYKTPAVSEAPFISIHHFSSVPTVKTPATPRSTSPFDLLRLPVRPPRSTSGRTGPNRRGDPRPGAVRLQSTRLHLSTELRMQELTAWRFRGAFAVRSPSRAEAQSAQEVLGVVLGVVLGAECQREIS